MLARVAAVLVTSVPALAQSPQWGFVTSYPVIAQGLASPSMDLADLNLDGRIDIIVVDSTTNGANVLIGQPNGTFQVTTHVAATGLYGMKLAIGDFDGDGIPDAVANKLMHGIGDGTFIQAATQPIGLGTLALAQGDINGDGWADLVTADFRVAFGALAGGLSVPFAFPSCSGNFVTIADVDADGDLDAVASNSSTFSILMNHGGTSFSTQCYGRGGWSHVAVADFTSDGIPDIAVDHRILIAQGNGMYTIGANVPNLDPGWYEAFDADGDGRKDLVGQGSPNGVLIARSLGTGQFDTSCFLSIPLTSILASIRVADVLGDSRSEIILLCNQVVLVYRNLAPDCNANGIDDPVEIANNLTPDCDSNGVPDSCQTDCDGSGTPDVCQIAAQPSLDLNSNGMLDSCEYIGTNYCFGDATGAACPCDPGQAGPIGRGCKNSLGDGGRLRAVGNAQVSLDSVTMTANGMDATAFAMLFQGTASQAAGLGSSFGDGLLCVNGTIVRMIIRAATAGSVSYGWAVSDPSLAATGMLPPTGGTRFYQVWYRDSASFCTPATYNMTNGVEIVWAQ